MTDKSKILIVDDNPENLIALKKTLEDVEVEIITATSGKEALKIILHNKFCMIILDVMMPGMDGYELAELIRSQKETQKVPLIFLTAMDATKKSIFKGYQAGAVDYLFKPVDENILLSKVNIFVELDQQKNELEQSNRELETFASIASHDLQEPLRKIVSFGDRLATRIPETDERGRDYLNRIQKSALRMSSLVEDLLQYTKVDTKKRSFESLDLNMVVHTVLEDLEIRLKDSEGVVNLNNLPIIEADPVQMYQLFLNLIGNALKFNRKGIPPVVHLDSVIIENGLWEISVEDNGIGIEDEYVNKIFKPFERLNGKTTYEGTGIGLTICNKIVSHHRGQITVKRKSTYGVTFQITLPEKQNNHEVC